MRSLLLDLKFGAQLLAKEPVFTTVAVLTLALCIGLNTAIFSLFHSILLRPLPYPESSRIVTIYNSYVRVGIERGANAVPDYFDRRAQTDVFEEVALAVPESYIVGIADYPERVAGVRATPSLFKTLKVSPRLGRAFNEREAEPGRDKVAVVTDSLWKQMFGADPAAVGRHVKIDNETYTIIGVLPAEFYYLRPSIKVFTPLVFTEEQMADGARHDNFAQMVARLAPGVSIDDARQRVEAINQINHERFPQYRQMLTNAGFATVVEDLQKDIFSEITPALFLLQAGVFFVLLMGCVNLANLLLVRANGRMKEVAVRMALGARRRRIVRQMLTESLVLGLVGGACGLLVAFYAIKLLPLLRFEQLIRGAEIKIDGWVMVFALASSVFSSLFFGAVPVVHIMRNKINEILADTSRTGSAGRTTAITRAILVAAQIAVALTLLIGAGLLVESFLRVFSESPGFRTQDVLTAQLTLPDLRYQEDSKIRGLTQEVLDSIAGLPGIQGAGISSSLPFGSSFSASEITVEGYNAAPGEGPIVPFHSSVDSNYFASMGIPLVGGRYFDDRDKIDSQPVVVIDQVLAKRYWRNTDPVGKRILPGSPNELNESPWYTVVGVVGNVKNTDLDANRGYGAVYFAFSQLPARSFSIVLWTLSDPQQLTAMVREEIRKIDAQIPLYDIRPLQERVDESMIERRSTMVLLAIFAAIAVLLAMIGIYGVIAYAVSQQTREIGIRMAFGARTPALIRQFLWQGTKLTAIGMAIGLLVAFALTRIMQSLLYRVQATDVSVYLFVTLVLGVTSILACLIPAQKASRVDPIDSLRYE